jgi:tetratricopeptide (TPR) repeat protein
MGSVHLAERSDGAFHKQVALKLIRRGLDSDDLLARFRAERQILAALDHPNVARLIDGGASADGRPYLVMEYVEGEDLLAWCRHHDLDVVGRLGLFCELCAAVQYAHGNLVIHLDIKPGNVLVTRAGVPKLLDFGIAKLVASDAALTQTGLRPLTPAYASPEQLRGRHVTTASDVWALGVLLYELVTGVHPFLAATVEETTRAILEDTPRRPSAVAGRRHARALAGDLDTVIGKALRKEPDARYGSVEQLSDDLGRWLDGRPVRARPPTLRYRARLFVRRHRWVVAGAALLGLSLVGGIAATTWQAERARAERACAEATRLRAEELVDFMLGDLRQKLEPSNRIEVLTDVARAVQTYLAALPATDTSPRTVEQRVRLLQQLARVRFAAGQLDEGARLTAQSQQALTGATGLDDATARHLRGEAASLQGWLLEERGELGPALAQYATAAALFSTLARADAKNAVAVAFAAGSTNDCGRVLYFMNRPREAVTRHQAALALFDGVPLPAGAAGRAPRRELAKSWLYLGRAREGLGDIAAAQQAYARHVTLAEALAKDFPDDIELQDLLAVAYHDLGRLLRLSGDAAAAAREHTRALALSEALLRRDPGNSLRADDIATGHALLGRAKEDQGDCAGALVDFNADVQVAAAHVAQEPGSATWKSALADGLTNVGRAERRLGHLAAARAAQARALALRHALAAAQPDDTVAGANLGVCQLELGRIAAAEGDALQATSQWEAARARFASATADAAASSKQRGRLAQALLELGRVAEARPIIDQLAATGAVDPELRALARAKGLERE